MRPSRLRRLLAMLATAWALSTSQAAADDAVDRAREYFRAGAQAYAVGEYAAAVQAFEQANALAPRPAVSFSIAQAERRLYVIDGNREHLLKAIRSYRAYLDAEPRGTRKVEAVQALSELVPLASSAETPLPSAPNAARPNAPGSNAPGSNAPAPNASAGSGSASSLPTRVMISSPTAVARISLDGGPATLSPWIGEVEPGKHMAHISAPGFRELHREIVAVKGALVAIDVSLQELPASLVVDGPEGSLLSIDGRVQGECPFPRPLEVTAGTHLLTLTKSGFVGVSREESLPHGRTTVLHETMPRTRQRTASLLMMGAGASFLIAGGIFTYFHLDQNSAANSFLNAQGHTEHRPEDLAQYESTRIDRDRFGTAALVAAGTGAGLLITGALLYLLDPGTVEVTKPRASAQEDTQRKDATVRPLPLVGPGITGLGVQGRF